MTPCADAAAGPHLLNVNTEGAKIAQDDFATGLRQFVAPQLNQHVQHVLDLALCQVGKAPRRCADQLPVVQLEFPSDAERHRFAKTSKMAWGDACGCGASHRQDRWVTRTAAPVIIVLALQKALRRLSSQRFSWLMAGIIIIFTRTISFPAMGRALARRSAPHSAVRHEAVWRILFRPFSFTTAPA
jgi:hypothetical protein